MFFRWRGEKLLNSRGEGGYPERTVSIAAFLVIPVFSIMDESIFFHFIKTAVMVIKKVGSSLSNKVKTH